MSHPEWVEALKELRLLCEQTARSVYLIAKQASFLMKSAGYLSEAHQGVQSARDKELSRICACTGFTVIDLNEMYRIAPDQSDERWVGGNLAKLRDDACRDIASKCNKPIRHRRQEGPPKREEPIACDPSPIVVKNDDRIREMAFESRETISSLNRRIAELERENETLRRENQQLKTKLANRKKRMAVPQ